MKRSWAEEVKVGIGVWGSSSQPVPPSAIHQAGSTLSCIQGKEDKVGPKAMMAQAERREGTE